MEYLEHAERAALHVSVSQVRAFQLCPAKYKLRYLLGAEPEHKSPNLVLGTAVHEALALYYMTLKAGMEVEPAAVEAMFTDSFVKAAAEGPGVLLEEGQKLTDIEAVGLGLVRTFLAQVQVPAEVVAVEAPFYVDVVDPETGEVLQEQLTGYLDAVVKDADGALVVLEHKTAARAWSQDQLEFDLQVSLYQAVTQAAAVRLQVLTKTKVPKMLVHDLQRSDREQVEAVTIVCRVLDAIRAGAFWQSPGWACKDCEFRKQCRG
jgi:CRISPR/Cas system-associated exonuclease Cas4 (RecB family)